MKRYAQVSSGVAVAITFANEMPETEFIIDVTEVTAELGWLYSDGGFSEPAISLGDQRVEYVFSDQQITAGGQELQFFTGNHYCEPLDVITLSGRIADDNGDTVTGITLPVTVKMPVVRHANGQPTGDEIYLNVTIQAGVISATGKIERSGDWKILQGRVNESLQRIGASWKLSAPDITILA